MMLTAALLPEPSHGSLKKNENASIFVILRFDFLSHVACLQLRQILAVQDSSDAEVSCMGKYIQKGSFDIHSFQVRLEVTKFASDIVDINVDPTECGGAMKIGRK